MHELKSNSSCDLDKPLHRHIRRVIVKILLAIGAANAEGVVWFIKSNFPFISI